MWIKGYQNWKKIFEAEELDQELGSSEISERDGYRLEEFRRIWITVPKAEPTGTVIIYGGLLDTPDELLPDVPIELLKSKIVVLVRWDKGLKGTLNKLNNLTRKEGSILFGKSINVTSVNGFSTGALIMQDQIGEYPFTGLMDPWISEEMLKTINLKFSADSPMASNYSNKGIEAWFSKKFWTEHWMGKTQSKISTGVAKLHGRLSSILGSRAKELPEYEHEQVKKDFLKENWAKM